MQQLLLHLEDLRLLDARLPPTLTNASDRRVRLKSKGKSATPVESSECARSNR